MRSLQYCCLMIPVKNRELLQVLLKFMVRLLDNHALSLSDDLPTKEKVIKIGGNVNWASSFYHRYLCTISLMNHNTSQFSTMPTTLPSPCLYNTLVHMVSFSPRLQETHSFSHQVLCFKTFIIVLHWQLIQSFSHAIFGVTADMDVIRLLYFMLEKFPEYFKVNIAWQTTTDFLLNS